MGEEGMRLRRWMLLTVETMGYKEVGGVGREKRSKPGTTTAFHTA